MNKKYLGAGAAAISILGWYALSSDENKNETQQIDQKPIEVVESIDKESPIPAPALKNPVKMKPYPRAKVASKLDSKKKFKVISRKVKAVAVRNQEKKLLAPPEMKPVLKSPAKVKGETPWIASLSGPGAAVAMDVSPDKNRECYDIDCTQNQDSAINVAGVVVESERFALKDEAVFKGALAQGDGRKTPFVYIE